MNRDYLEPRLPGIMKSDKLIKVVLFLGVVIIFMPWIAFTTGSGQVTAIDPNERVQTITAPVSGFIQTWHVKEGQRLKKGDLIATMSDNDANLLQRYQQERGAAKANYDSAILMRDTAKINVERQKSLYDQGLSARKEYEKAKIEFSKLEMEAAKALVAVTKSETLVARQSSQEVRAPRDGVIIRVLPGERGQIIKDGTSIAMFSPDVTLPAVELWIDGNDASMVVPGQKARVQFEGWPSLQIAGWPSIAINTFEAKVHLVDQASSYQGKFRVLLVPSGPWPGQNVLRIGIHARGFIQLSPSFVLREIWRQLNNFPAFQEPISDELGKILQAREAKK
jgi:multidrug efflux pump subunit AcrA (membrane-fusion protein)